MQKMIIKRNLDKLNLARDLLAKYFAKASLLLRFVLTFRKNSGVSAIKFRISVLRTIPPYFHILFYGSIRIRVLFDGDIEKMSVIRNFIKLALGLNFIDNERQSNTKMFRYLASL